MKAVPVMPLMLLMLCAFVCGWLAAQAPDDNSHLAAVSPIATNGSSNTTLERRPQ